jgi:DNA-binding HxlR family transcriptional regulator
VTLEIVGDPWSLLIVRDLMFKGCRTFLEFSGAGEGIASNVLSDRLARLEANGILTKMRDPEDARRFRYWLTEKGIDLAPVLVEMVLWAAHHEETDAPEKTVRAMQADRDRFLEEVRKKWAEGAGGYP